MPIRFQVDADFYDHPKSIGMSDAATALWVRAGSYSAAKLLDGFIADHVLATLSRTPEAAADELVARGLWKRRKGGYQFHQYDERNLTKARVEADREHDRTKKRRQRSDVKSYPQPPVDNGTVYASAQVRPATVPPGHPEGIPGDIAGTPGRNPDVSVSVSVSESVSGSGRHASPPQSRCNQHRDNPNPGPCGPCAEARRGAEQWQADKRARVDSADKCPMHRGQLAHNCAMCKGDAKAVPYPPAAAADVPTQHLRLVTRDATA